MQELDIQASRYQKWHAPFSVEEIRRAKLENHKRLPFETLTQQALGISC
jgi:hypothetical protein